MLQQGVRSITDLMVMPGLINLDFADVRSVMGEMGKAMMGTGEGEGENRALEAAERAIANPLLDGVSMQGAKGVIISIIGGEDMKLLEVDEAANHIRELVDPERQHHLGLGVQPRSRRARSASRWSPPASSRAPSRRTPPASRSASAPRARPRSRSCRCRPRRSWPRTTATLAARRRCQPARFEDDDADEAEPEPTRAPKTPTPRRACRSLTSAGDEGEEEDDDEGLAEPAEDSAVRRARRRLRLARRGTRIERDPEAATTERDDWDEEGEGEEAKATRSS